VRLNNEIRAALTGGAWEAKQPLTPEPIRPAEPPAQPRRKATEDDDTDEVRVVLREDASDASHGTSAEAFERVGIASLRSGAYDRAEDAFQASLEADPRGVFAHYLIAQARFSQGQFATAAASLQQAVRANPDWLRAPVDVREFYGADDAFTSRLTELRQAARTQGDLTFLLGYMAYFSQDLEGALAAFDRHLEEHPADPAARAYRDVIVSQLEASKGLEEF
jgi:TolA-binding protein